MKTVKKILGILLVIFAGLLCMTSCYCFFAAITGKQDGEITGAWSLE